uniref:Uncharacterized protein n=1 Tax=Nymphaea colorata TaxID=210225 RepID=A0A5K1C342_9MAGN
MDISRLVTDFEDI